MVLILLNRKKNYAMVLTLVGTTVAAYFVGNLLFSPASLASKQWFIFRVNRVGAILGLIGGLKRGAMICVSLAWLFCTPLPDFYESLAFFRVGRKWLVLFLRNIQSMKREVILLRQSFAIRCPRTKWYALGIHLNFARLALQAILFRIFDAISTITYASETHHCSRNNNQGTISLNRIFVRYSASEPMVLRGVSLNVEEGQFVYLGGRARAGKTTLMRTIAGYIPRITGEYAGSVLIGGVDTSGTDLTDIASLVRLVPSDPALSIIGLTVGQDIMMTAPGEEIARQCLSAMGIEHLWGRETTALSGGEQARLVLAGLLASGVKVVLLDSPLEQLDPDGRRDFLAAMRDFQAQESRTIIVADPAFDELRDHVQRFLLIEDGGIALDVPISGLTADVLERSGLRTTSSPLSIVTAANASRLPVAEMRDVDVTLGDYVVLTSMSFCICEGECVVVVGPNGGGKTTAFLTLSGVVRPSSGRVVLRRRVGFVFQNASLQMIEMTSRDELELKPKLMHFEKERIRNFLTKELEWAALRGDEWPGDLHPQQARLLAIGAMKPGAEIMIFDEPTVGLDLAGVEKFIDLVRELNEANQTTIVITHDPRIMGIAGRILCIKGGRVAYARSNSEGFAG